MSANVDVTVKCGYECWVAVVVLPPSEQATRPIKQVATAVATLPVRESDRLVRQLDIANPSSMDTGGLACSSPKRRYSRFGQGML
jgi:hypothetical protein